MFPVLDDVDGVLAVEPLALPDEADELLEKFEAAGLALEDDSPEELAPEDDASEDALVDPPSAPDFFAPGFEDE